MLLPLATGVGALFLALVFTPIVRERAIAIGAFNVPRADRWNRRRVAMHGGIAIYASAMVAMVPFLPSLTRTTWAMVLTGGFLFALGVLDDRIELPPRAKMAGQVLAAVVMVASGLRFGLPGGIWSYVDMGLTFLWVVGLCNSFNLLDNMDGLTAGVSAIVGGYLALIAVALGTPVVPALCAAVAGACLGYLRYNYFPASIFMGDGGSLFIGNTLASLALMVHGDQQHSTAQAIFVPLLVMAVPLMDTILVMLIRPWFGRRVTQGGRDHTSHRLVATGLNDVSAVKVLWLFTAGNGLAALLAVTTVWWLAAMMALVSLFATVLLGWYLVRVQVYEDPRNFSQSLDLVRVPILSEHRYRRLVGMCAFDAFLIGAALFSAFVLRFEGLIDGPAIQTRLLAILPTVLICHIAAYWLCGVYRAIWRFTSTRDLAVFANGVLLGGLLSVLALQILGRDFPGLSTLLIINAMLQFFALSSSRVFFRLLRDTGLAARYRGHRALMVGTSEQAEAALRRFMVARDSDIRPVGLVTRFPAEIGLRIQGVPVVCSPETIASALASYGVGEVVLLDMNFPAADWQETARVCHELGVRVCVHRDLVEEVPPD